MDDVILSAAQSRAGRALLGWSRADLARYAGVSTSCISDFERGLRWPHARTRQALRSALESGGILFWPSTEGFYGAESAAGAALTPRLLR